MIFALRSMIVRIAYNSILGITSAIISNSIEIIVMCNNIKKRLHTALSIFILFSITGAFTPGAYGALISVGPSNNIDLGLVELGSSASVIIQIVNESIDVVQLNALTLSSSDPFGFPVDEFSVGAPSQTTIPSGFVSFFNLTYSPSMLNNGGTVQLTIEVSSQSIFETHDVFVSATPAPEVVPIPAAAWLFGSGLLGLFGIARRKKA